MAFRSISAVSPNAICDLPAGAAANDILTWYVVSDDDQTITWPDGTWTGRGRIATGGTYALQWATRVATGSDPATFTFTEDFGAVKQSYMTAHSGRNTTSPVTASASTTISSASTSPLSVALSGVTATTGDDIVFLAMVRPTTGTDRWTFAAPGSYTERADENRDYLSSTIATRDNVSSGATGTLTATATRSVGSDTGAFAGWVISLAAASGGATTKRTLTLGVG